MKNRFGARENPPRLKHPAIMTNPPDLGEAPEHLTLENPPREDGPFIKPTEPSQPKGFILSNPPPLVETYEEPPPNKEIERKFLLKEGVVFADRLERSDKILQGYLSRGPVVRVRIQNGRGYLTIKGSGLLTRAEYEYRIPTNEAEELLELCVGSRIVKTRHIVIAKEGALTTRWQVDEFHSPIKLWMAEVELPSEDAPFVKPSWIGEEVTHDIKYTNAAISTVPTK